MIIPAIKSLIRMRKALESGKGIFLSHEELRDLHDSNKKLPWDAVDEFVQTEDDWLFKRRLKQYSPKKYSPEDIAAFNRINDTLTELEPQLMQEVGLQLELLNKRLSDEGSWITDFEVELHIQFYLKESDPRYNDNIDNIIFKEKHLLPMVNPQYEEGIGEWFDFDPSIHEQTRVIKALTNPACELFHTIFNHAHFPQAEAQNTDCIWVDIEVMPQMEINLGKDKS
jgi:hypothetical protein